LTVQAQEVIDPLPSPLTLEQALALADEPHPDLALATAELQAAEARRALVDARDGSRLDLQATASLIEPSELAADSSRNDSWASLRLSKQLYDFGFTKHSLSAARAEHESRRWELLNTSQQRRLDIMESFFAVLLADLEYARDNEAMSIAFIRFDRATNRHELGQVSDIALLDLEQAYQQSRLRVTASQQRQRTTRSLLALSLNRPRDLPAELEPPVEAPDLKSEEFETLLQRILESNPTLLALQAEVDSARESLQAAEVEEGPRLRGELTASEYNRKLGGRNPLSASLVFEMPLFDSGLGDSKAALQRTRLYEREAKLKALEYQLRQQALEYWMELQRLQLRAEELRVIGDFRDLVLERSRARYELEVASDLGDSMSQIADLHLQQAQNHYQKRLLRARLEALAGNLLPSRMGEKGRK
jgi:outer membrane protein TolC